MIYRPALALALLAAFPAGAQSLDASKELYQALLSAELDAGNNYPSGNMARPDKAVEDAIASGGAAQEDCRSAAASLLTAINLLRVNNVNAAATSYADYLDWRSMCETFLGAKEAEAPLGVAIELYLKR